MQTDYRSRPTTQEFTWDGRPAGVSIRIRLAFIGLILFTLTFGLAATVFSRTKVPNAHFERFVPQIEAAVKSGDNGFFASKIVGIKYPCSTFPPISAGQVSPCAGLDRGSSVNVLLVAGARGYEMLPPADYSRDLVGWLTNADSSQSDEYGDGAVHFYSTRCGQASDLPPYTCGGYESILTSIQQTPTGPERQARLVAWAKFKGHWQIVGDSIVLADEPRFEYLLAGGCAYC